MRLWVLVAILFTGQTLASEKITLSLPSQVDGGHVFFHELLYEALSAQGYSVAISSPSEHIPQKRVVKMVESGALTLTWLLPTEDRNRRFVSVPVALTNGLIGKRILLIPPSLQPQFDKIGNLNDLRHSGLVAGLGINWFDVDVWEANNLPVYLADGEWRSLYQRLSPDGAVNYFPRGLNEIVAEAEMNPNLAIEQQLMIQYDRDFYFYLSSKYKHYQPIIEQALVAARNSGLIDELVEKHWSSTFDLVNPAERVLIRLNMPASISQNN